MSCYCDFIQSTNVFRVNGSVNAEHGVKQYHGKEQKIKDNSNVLLAFNAVKKGDFATIKFLVEQKKVNINEYSQNGMTLLMKAVCGKNTEIVEYLLIMTPIYF